MVSVAVARPRVAHASTHAPRAASTRERRETLERAARDVGVVDGGARERCVVVRDAETRDELAR